MSTHIRLSLVGVLCLVFASAHAPTLTRLHGNLGGIVRHACKGLLLVALLIPLLACTRAANLALNSAARMGNTDAVQALIDAGANVDAKDEYGWTALMEAAARGHTATVQALLEGGADVNAKEKEGSTALMWAAFWGHTDTVQALLDAGADINATNNEGETALAIAQKNGHTEVVEILKKARAKEAK